MRFVNRYPFRVRQYTRPVFVHAHDPTLNFTIHITLSIIFILPLTLEVYCTPSPSPASPDSYSENPPTSRLSASTNDTDNKASSFSPTKLRTSQTPPSTGPQFFDTPSPNPSPDQNAASHNGTPAPHGRSQGDPQDPQSPPYTTKENISDKSIRVMRQ